MDVLSHHPFNPSCDSASETHSDEVEIISYSSVCEVVDQCLYSFKIPKDVKQEAQDISFVVQPIIDQQDKNKIVSALNVVSIFEQVMLQK